MSGHLQQTPVEVLGTKSKFWRDGVNGTADNRDTIANDQELHRRRAGNVCGTFQEHALAIRAAIALIESGNRTTVPATTFWCLRSTVVYIGKTMEAAQTPVVVRV